MKEEGAILTNGEKSAQVEPVYIIKTNIREIRHAWALMSSQLKTMGIESKEIDDFKKKWIDVDSTPTTKNIFSIKVNTKETYEKFKRFEDRFNEF